ncbi:tandem-95 repeat protein [Zavarzinella formosa]|uniref:tandem-95 repeat protein n=1 Tax=Zavarzinella formosa TaxID=360055 RepID=UPI0002EFD2A6|nr:Ig-like domain-containing protein [Zavarzinella formosa]
MSKLIRPRLEGLHDRITPVAGALDTTFNGTGMLTRGVLGYSNQGLGKIMVQPDGKIVASSNLATATGDSRPAIIRFNSDGSLDNTFSGDGVAPLDTVPGGTGGFSTAALLPDGKILGVGTARINNANQIMVVRLNADGTLDNTFSGDGFAFATSTSSDGGDAVAVQPDGKIVVGGDGGAPAPGQPNRMLAVRFNTDGSLDNTFGTAGFVKIPFGPADPAADSVVIQPDGNIILAGHTSSSGGNFGFALARLKPDGSLDTTFGTGGLVQTAPNGMQFEGIREAVLLANGKILAAGGAYIGTGEKPELALLRYNANGSLDTTFAGGGVVTVNMPENGGIAGGIAVQPNGRILVAGADGIPGGSKSILARFTPDGQLDTTFGVSGQTLMPGIVLTNMSPGQNTSFGSIAIQSDRKIVTGGYAGGALSLARFNVASPAPTAVADNYSVDEDNVLSATGAGVLVNDTVPVGTSAVIMVTRQPAHGVLQMNQDGSFTYTPAPNYNGPDSFDYKLDNDLESNTVTVSLTVNPVPDPPTAVNDAYALDEDTVLTVSGPGIRANDSLLPDGTPAAIVVTRQPAHGTLDLNQDGGFIYTPAPDYFGQDSFEYKLDNGLQSNPATVTLTVNPVPDQPTAVADSYTLNEDNVLTVNSPGVLGNDTLPDNGTAVIIVTRQPDHGRLNMNPNGGFTYTPNPNFNGPDSFDYKLYNGLESNTVTVSLSVSSVIDAPVAAPDSYTLSENNPLNVDSPGVLANDTIIDANPLLVLVTRQPAHGTLSMNQDGGFTYSPDTDYTGADSFQYKLDNGLQSSPVTVSLTVNPLSGAPVAAPDSYTLDEDTRLAIGSPGVLGNDTLTDGRPVSIIVTRQPDHGTLQLNQNGGFTYDPAPNYNGPDSFDYKLDNGLRSNTVTVSLTVNPVTDPPVAAPDAYTTDEDTVLTVNSPGVLGNDTLSDNLPAAIIVTRQPARGVLQMRQNGSFTYTPAPNYNGSDSFEYKLDNGLSSDPATVSLTINPEPDAPVAVADSYAIDEDNVLTVGSPGVLGNDTLSDGLPASIIVTRQPDHGSLQIRQDGSFTYTPAPNFHGADSFAYKLDNGLQSSPATVSLTVNSVNDPPTAADDHYSLPDIGSLVVPAAAGLLANDRDIDSAALSAILVIPPPSGTLNLNPNGSFTFTPAEDFAGQITFQYKANDGQADSPVRTVTLTRGAITVVDGTKLFITGTDGVDSIRLRSGGGAAISVERDTPNGVLKQTYRPPAGKVFSLIAVNLAGGDDTFDSSAISRPVRLTGGAGNDLLKTGAGADTIYGDTFAGLETGNDTITSGVGDDRIIAGNGNNRIDAGTGVNIVTAGDGDNTITTGTGNDYISVGNGADIITAGAGNDSIRGGNGNNRIDAGTGNDTVAAGNGDNTILAGTGNDFVAAGNGGNQIDAGAGNNMVRAGTGANAITTGTGNDTVTIGTGADTINTEAGNDSVIAGDGINTINTGAGNDTIKAGAGQTFADAGTGNDLISVLGGTNHLIGGTGNDIILGGSGADTIEGGTGNDLLAGGLGADAIDGGAGNDILFDGSVAIKNSVTDTLAKVLAGNVPTRRATLVQITGRLIVTPDAASADSLTGGTGVDWFWTTDGIDATDRLATEPLNGVS